MNETLWKTFSKLRASQLTGPDAFADFFRREGIRFQPSDLDTWAQFFAAQRAGETGYIPTWLAKVFATLGSGFAPKTICDPWAGVGLLPTVLREAFKGTPTTALTRNAADHALGQVLAPDLSWRLGDPVQLLEEATESFDLAASVLPVGMRSGRSLNVVDASGASVAVRGDIASLLLVAAARRLTPSGAGLFVVTPSFFFSDESSFRQLPSLGLGLAAALALPPRTFAPLTNIDAYLVVVRPHPTEQMFVAALSNDQHANLQVFENFRAAKEGATLELGRLVDPKSFTGLDPMRAAARAEEAEGRFGGPPVALGDLALAVNLGRSVPGFAFTALDNAIYVPLLGTSEVVTSIDDLRIKSQNYAQVAVNANLAKALFVARYLNSDLGREMMDGRRGGFIPKLNKKTLRDIPVFVPNMETQQQVLALEAKVAGESNVLLGLQNELGELRRQLWSDPRTAPDVAKRLDGFSSRLDGDIREHTDERLEHWFETLPFPLASILRAWQATPSQDFKTKHEHLLHFFEGTAAFVGVVLLSAFQSSDAMFEVHRPKLAAALEKQKQSFERATFGMWRVVAEFLGKQTRELLASTGKPDDERSANRLCADMFADSSLALPHALSDKRLMDVLATTNKYRNDWQGHGGVVGPEEARRRNDLLLVEVQRVREAMADGWAEVQLIRAFFTVARNGQFENEVAVMTGSNSEFLKETRLMATWLDVDRLYLVRKGAPSALKLLPLVRVGQSPPSTLNACYFFNRLEKDGARFVSYHFADTPEIKGAFGDAESVIKVLTRS